MNNIEFSDFLDEIRSDFRFKYVGAGYFRDKNIEKGEKADIIHGNEIIEEFCKELKKTI